MINMPQSAEDERAIIGCCLTPLPDAAEICEQAVDLLRSPEVFWGDIWRDAFAAIKLMVGQGGSCDPIAFMKAWRSLYGERVIPPDILVASDAIASPRQLPEYANEVLDAYRRRQVILEAQALMARANDRSEPLESSLAAFEASTEVIDPNQRCYSESGEVTQDFNRALKQRQQNKGRLSGLATGYLELDQLLDGLQLGQQVVVAARPGQGKSALGLNIAEHVAIRSGIPTLVISLEMEPERLMRRVISSVANVPLNRIKSGSLSPGEPESIHKAVEKVRSSPLYWANFVGSGADVERVGLAIRKHKERYGCQFVLIDYLTRIATPKGYERRTYEVAHNSGRLYSFAHGNNIALLTLAQLNRDSEAADRPPRLCDIGESTQIERDADVVGLIYRPRTKEDPQGKNAKLIIAKSRDGQVGSVCLHFNAPYCRFENKGSV